MRERDVPKRLRIGSDEQFRVANDTLTTEKSGLRIPVLA